MNTTNEMQKKEDELIFNIILSGNIDLIYEALGKDGITASVQLGVLKEDEVAEFYTENKFFEEDNPNIIKIETEDDYYLDENLKNSKELSFENLDILLENLNEENISSILDFLEKEKEKYNNYNLFKDDDLNKLIENAALSNILNKEENISDEIKASNLELREFFIHKYMELTGTTYEETLEKVNNRTLEIQDSVEKSKKQRILNMENNSNEKESILIDNSTPLSNDSIPRIPSESLERFMQGPLSEKIKEIVEENQNTKETIDIEK